MPDRNWNSYQGSTLATGAFKGVTSVLDKLSIIVVDSDGSTSTSSGHLVKPVNDPPMLFVGSRQTFDLFSSMMTTAAAKV